MSQNLIIIISVGVLLIAIVLYFLVKSFMDDKNIRNGDDLFISPEDIYEQVKLSISGGNHAVGQKLAKKYLKENPTHDRLRIILARSYYETGAFRDAIEQLEILTQNFPERKDLFLMLADSYNRLGLSSDAIDMYLKLMDLDPDNPDILIPLAELYNNINHKKSALNIYKHLLNMDINETTKIDYYKQTAMIYKDLGEYENAIEYVNFALNADKNNITLLYLLKDLYELTKNVEKEVDVMNRLLVLAPTDAYLQLDLVHLYYKSKQYDSALDVAIPSLNTPGADIESLQNIIANIYIKTNRVAEGVKILEDIIKIYPDSIRITETLGYGYRLIGEYEKSVEFYKRLIDLSDLKTAKIYNNELSSVYCDWALHMYNIGDTKQAFVKFEEAVKLNPDNPDIYEGLSQVNFLAKNYNDAIRQMQKAIDLDPGNSRLYIYLAGIYEEMNNVYEAERMYKEAIYIDKDNPICHAKLGIIKLKQKDIQKAMKHLSIAVEHEPKNWDYIYNLALVYELSGDNKKAIECYNMVLELNPEHKESINNLKMLGQSQ